MPYKHGAYGEITSSQVANARSVDVTAVYVGTAPINLIRGYDDAGLINIPIKIKNLGDAQSKIGVCSDWTKYTLCEVIDYHFNNTLDNVGPIYIINVLDPDTHRKSSATTKSLVFTNGKSNFVSDTIILDTFAIADKAEGVDYAIDYDYATNTVTIRSLIDGSPLTGTLSATFYEVDLTKITNSVIIGGKSSSGEYSGIAAINLLYVRENVVPNLIAAPGWSHIPEIYQALVTSASQINGHWDAFVAADIPLISGGSEVDTIAKAIAWKTSNAYNSATSKVFWPMAEYAGKVYHLSTIYVATAMLVDYENGSIPYESASNKHIQATCQYFGESASNQGFDLVEGNDLNEKGITTLVYWEGEWKLWGPHTAAYVYGGNYDAAAAFETNIRMLMYITNGFQRRNGTRIDTPMSPNDRDSIQISEQAELDALAGIGALIGSPKIMFLENENSTDSLMNGDFVWHITATPTPPLLSATARVTYTDEGFAAYFGEGA